jgi:hypothetical protein
MTTTGAARGSAGHAGSDSDGASRVVASRAVAMRAVAMRVVAMRAGAMRAGTMRAGVMRTGVALAVAALAGCASAPPADPDAPRVVTGYALGAYAAHEECRTLSPGDRLDYRFTSTVPLAFNIHYHEGSAVLMPISREGVTADSGIFQPVVRQDFCLMWEAGATPATLEYRVSVRRRGP